jgi:type II secretory pathway component GspD/PulD (secretin)
MPNVLRTCMTRMPTWTRSGGVALGMIAALACVDTAPAAGNQPAWFAHPYQYVVINQDLRGVLTEFGRNVGVPVILTDKVGGRVRGQAAERTNGGSEQTAGGFLQQLAEANGLTWYFDGSILYVSTDQEFSTQLVEGEKLRLDAVVAEMKRLSLLDERFPLRSADNAGPISVSGPPAYVAVVRQVAEKLRPPPPPVPDEGWPVRVVRGGAPEEIVRVQGPAMREPRSGKVAPVQSKRR